MKYNLNLDIEFRKNPYKGVYIALEGVDGSGKTTQGKALEKFFKQSNKVVVPTGEPRLDLPGGDLIQAVFSSKLIIPAEALQHALTMNRLINQNTIIEPALQQGSIVISDRCMWSAVPYGLLDKAVTFSGREAGRMLLTQSILSPYHQSIVPDITFYIDIEPETAIKRSMLKKGRRQNDFYEKETKLTTVVKGYRWLVRQFQDEFVIIDGEKTVSEVTDSILKILKNTKHII